MIKLFEGPKEWSLRCLGAVRGCVCVILLFPLILAINVIQMLSILVLPFSRKGFRAVNRCMAQIFWGWSVFVQKRLWNIQFVVTGDIIPAKENAFMISNHQQLVDIPVLLTLAMSKGRIGDFKWFVKDILKFVPGIGWGMLFLNCIFVKRSWAQDEETIKATFRSLMSEGFPFWVVSFVEGTRITESKLMKARDIAQRRNKRVPLRTLPPRTRGFLASIEGLREKLDAVYDVTIGYPYGIPSFWQYGCGYVKEVHIHIKRSPISELPVDQQQLREWLENTFK